MTDQEQLEALAQKLFEAKRERRRELAALPIEEKFEILLRLQELSYEIGLAAGRNPPKPWRLK